MPGSVWLHLNVQFRQQLLQLVAILRPEIVEQRAVIPCRACLNSVAAVILVTPSEAADEVAQRCVDAGRAYQPAVDFRR